ncbi:thioredoxin family protein [Seonamhaeicola aphaedonensis]|uniref:Thiol-disulfide isomerase/thioredoxin n=1 Tax=Seonamhaeicola aphaedonensis TaxID=1461338 RepID=A0A3D9HMC9_9FLAO|nr:thioredoxin family protein [Seonamhaeicola aphaedonensis]RED50644.1 thiol-disulfide isomerase/thioredoxin [Seonamhaeicola aphaedonensis]
MNTIIKAALENSMSYESYRTLMTHLAEHGETTGDEKSDTRINFTKLNNRRMKRWDKTLKVSEKAKKRLMTFETDVTWLVITESWCGDAAHVMPALNKIAEMNPKITMHIVIRDNNKELINMFLTDGNQAVPKLIMIDDESGTVLDTYGPRPSEATGYVNRFKAANGALTPQFKEDLQHWYNNDRGMTIVEDITEMLCRFQPSFCQ